MLTRHVFSVYSVATTRACITGGEADRLNPNSQPQKKCAINPINKSVYKVVAT